MSRAELHERIQEARTLAAQGYAYDALEARCNLYRDLLVEAVRAPGEGTLMARKALSVLDIEPLRPSIRDSHGAFSRYG